MMPDMHRHQCRICAGKAEHVFTHQVLGKYDCAYFLCAQCGLLQTQAPFWLGEAYDEAIAAADTGLVQRNIQMCNILSTVAFCFFDRNSRYLDVAGGYGLLTRLMRDVGFDCYWSDKHCTNLLARGFEAQASQDYALTSAFEVLEHLEDPMQFIGEALSRSTSRSLICSTYLFKGAIPAKNWWYYAFATGQHISFYQPRTLQYIAKKFGVKLHSSGPIHLFTSQTINPALFKMATQPTVARLIGLAPKSLMTSRTAEDHYRVLKRSARTNTDERLVAAKLAGSEATESRTPE